MVFSNAHFQDQSQMKPVMFMKERDVCMGMVYTGVVVHWTWVEERTGTDMVEVLVDVLVGTEQSTQGVWTPLD